MEKYDPILRALREAKDRISEELPLTDKEFDKVERALDIFFDCIEQQLATHDNISRHSETGMLVVTHSEKDSSA